MKPHVICLMASSVDGRTLHSRWRPKGSGGDLFEQVNDELAGDAWLVGRVTGQEFAKRKPYPASTKESFPRQPWFARRDAKAYGVVLDAHGKIGWGRSDIGGDPIVVVLSEAVSDAHLAGLRGEGVPESRSSISPSRWTSSIANSREAAATGGRRRCQRCHSARGIGRRAQFDTVSSRGRREGCTERRRLHGCGGRSPSPRDGDDAGEQPGYGRWRNAAAAPDPERGYSGANRSVRLQHGPTTSRSYRRHRRRRRGPDGRPRTQHEIATDDLRWLDHRRE
jgi:hypothetical protein